MIPVIIDNAKYYPFLPLFELITTTLPIFVSLLINNDIIKKRILSAYPFDWKSKDSWIRSDISCYAKYYTEAYRIEAKPMEKQVFASSFGYLSVGHTNMKLG